MRELDVRKATHFASIPVDWKVVPLLRVTKYVTGFTPPSGNESYYGDGYPWANISDLDGRRVLSETQRGLSLYAIEKFQDERPAPKGSLLFSFKLSLGNVAIAGRDLYTNEAIAAFSPGKELDINYAYYCFPVFLPLYSQTNIYGAELLGGSRFERTKIPLPPFESQQRIADYLDRETSEIDAAVADLDRYVELLEKRRTALVADTLSRFVSPGNSNTVGLSGANLGRVGLVSRLIRRGISPSYVDDGIPVVSQKCVRPGGKIDYEVCRFHDPDARSISESLFIREGDVLINSTGTGTLGRSCVAREVDGKTTWDSHVTLVRPNLDDVSPGYLGWVIANQESKLIKFSVGSTNQIELSRDTVVNLEIPLLPLGEQQKVADYLDRETIAIDDLITESKKLRDLLLKRRSVLITEVVTGRKQV